MIRKIIISFTFTFVQEKGAFLQYQKLKISRKYASFHSFHAYFWIFFIRKTYCHQQHFLIAKYTFECKWTASYPVCVFYKKERGEVVNNLEVDSREFPEKRVYANPYSNSDHPTDLAEGIKNTFGNVNQKIMDPIKAIPTKAITA